MIGNGFLNLFAISGIGDLLGENKWQINVFYFKGCFIYKEGLWEWCLGICIH